MSEKKIKSVEEKKKTRKRIRTIIIIALLIAAIVFVYSKFFKKDSGSADIGTAFVSYGSITSKVQGSGLTKTKSTETLTLQSSGTVEEVYVSEGQEVEAGTPLFVINSPGAKVLLQNAKSTYDEYVKQLNNLRKDLDGLSLAPKYSGKVVDVVKLEKGDQVVKGEKLATLIDDRTMKLEQYYSYAYEDCFYVGQKVNVSIPTLMSVVEGNVEAVHMVSRITKEGSKLFAVEVSLKNQGVLTEGMTANATIENDGEIIYPYESSVLKYNKVSDLVSSVTGTVLSSKLIDYLEVDAGEVLVQITADDTDTAIFNLEKQVDDAKLALDRAQQNFDNCSAVAPISGKVIGLSIQAGDTIPENSMLVTISDTKQITINGTVDERNISYIQPGMSVELNQWGNMAFGTVDSISWNSTINNGVATYPITIIADNYDGVIQVNSYIDYTILASQNDNCLLIPLQAVRNVVLADGSEASVVFVRNASADRVVELMMVDEEIPEGFNPVKVELGISDNANVEIVSGINEGEEIFTQYIRGEYWG